MWHQKAKGPPDGPPIFLIFVEKLNCPQSQAYQSISPVGTGLSLTDRALGVSLGTSIGNYSPLIAPQPVKLKIQFWQQSVGSSPTFGTISRRALGFAAILLYKSRLYRTVPFLLEKGLYPAGYLLIYTLTAALACYQSTVGRLFLPMICKLSLDAIRIRAFLCPDRKRALQAFANLTFAIAYYDHL